MACPPYFLRLALLASPIVDIIFAGKAPWTLSLTELDTTLPYSWKEQMKLFGILSLTAAELEDIHYRTASALYGM